MLLPSRDLASSMLVSLHTPNMTTFVLTSTLICYVRVSVRSAVALQLERTKECAGCPAFKGSALQHVSGHSQQERTFTDRRCSRSVTSNILSFTSLNSRTAAASAASCRAPVPRLPCSVTRLKATFSFRWFRFKITRSIALAPDIVSATAEYSCN